MPAYRHTCDIGHHHAALAILTQVRPGVFICDDHMAARDKARDQHAAQTNRTTAVDEARQRLLGIWRAEQRRLKHGGPTW